MEKLLKTHKNINAILTDSKDGNLGYHVAKNAHDLESARQNRGQILEKYFMESDKGGESENLDSETPPKKPLSKKTLLYLNQIHSNHIFAITKENLVKLYKDGNLENTKKIESYSPDSINPHINEIKLFNEINLGEADGIICENPHFIALIMVADCNPILLFDPTRPVFALLHAGRLGVGSRILSMALEILKSDFHTKIQNLHAFIGASIRQCCYEIGENLVTEFHPKYIANNRLDMITMLRDEMRECGLLDSKITISPTCTCCDESYFSYRRQGNKSGRFGIFARLRF